jgi:7-carboxy-7-deazaguanine synthase
MTLGEILDRLQEAPGCRLVEVTGGEPLLQEAVNPFMQGLLDAGYEVLLETGGSLDLAPVPAQVRKIVDIKCPGSGEVGRNRWENLALLQSWDELKFVLAHRADYEWARQVVRDRGLDQGHTLLFSPVFGQLSYLDLATWILEDRLPVRMQVQLHKHIWDPKARGV